MLMPDGGRVITGLAGGVRLAAPPSGTRPLTDRVKQALFATLQAEGALDDGFLDLFAGSGAAGIEALSRGADRATFVDRDDRACATIEANLLRAGLDGGRVVRADVTRFLAAGRGPTEEPYAACLADPPYDAPVLETTLAVLADPAHTWLSDGAVVVAKHFWRDPPPSVMGDLGLTRQRRFGETMLSFYRRQAQETG
jgi:16S rRNA (guanine966-N2)-methyltransferase